MSNIRDEYSKVFDVRIPPNGYKRYLKEMARTGAFDQARHEDLLIVLGQAVEDLQNEVSELRHEAGGRLIGSPNDISTGSGKAFVKFKEIEKPSDYICPICRREFDQRIGLLGHSRSHKKDATIKSSAGRDSS